MSQAQAKPAYVLAGKDPLLQGQARSALIDRLLGDADSQLCTASFDGDAELAEVLDELRTLPFLAPHRVVILREAEAFLSAYRDKLETYLQSPASCASLILCVSSWPKNTRLAKMPADVIEVIDCEAPTGRDLENWVRGAFQQRGKKVQPQAAAMLAQTVGSDLASLDTEIEKLSLYAADRGEVTVDDVTAIVSAQAAPEAFALVNAIVDGDVRRALECLDRALQTRGAEFQLLGQLGWHVRRSLQIAQAMAGGTRPEQAMKSARVFYRQQQAMGAFLRRRPLPRLREDMRRLIAADLGLKSSQNVRAAMQRLVMHLAG